MLELSGLRRDQPHALIYTPCMRPPDTVRHRLSRTAVPLACAALLAGCTTSPTSGRAQFNVLPGELETTVPSLRYEAKTLIAGGDYCRAGENTCPTRESAERLAQRIAPVAEQLGLKTAQLSPEMTHRIPQVEVIVVPGDAPTVSSSAGGKIAVGAGLARLELSETDLAFALAREFGRLAAAHHRESTSAGLAVSLIAGSPLTGAYLATTLLADLLFPMGALAKLGISLAASMGTEQLVEVAQQDEADEFAGKLLMAAGYDPKTLALALPDAPQGGMQIGWLASYVASRARVAATAQPDPWPDNAGPSLALDADHEPWPDEAPFMARPDETPQARPDVPQATEPAAAAGTAAEPQQAPPRAKPASAQGAKKPGKKIRKASGRNRQR